MCKNVVCVCVKMLCVYCMCKNFVCVCVKMLCVCVKMLSVCKNVPLHEPPLIKRQPTLTK